MKRKLYVCPVCGAPLERYRFLMWYQPIDRNGKPTGEKRIECDSHRFTCSSREDCPAYRTRGIAFDRSELPFDDGR